MAECFCQFAATIWQINCDDEAVLAAFQKEYSAFMVAAAPPCCRLFISPGAVPGSYMADKGIPHFHKEGDKILATHLGSYQGFYSLQEPVAYFTIARSGSSGERCAPPAMSICNIIRLMMMIWLPHYQRLLLHSAAVLIDGQGYLLLGQSGYGKSTIAKLFDQQALTGDVTLVGPAADGTLYVWPTFLDYLPYKTRSPEGYPLARIYLLSGHQPYSLAEFPSRAAKIKALLENSVGVGWTQAEEMLQVAAALVEKIPLQKITYLLAGDGRGQLPYIQTILQAGRL